MCVCYFGEGAASEGDFHAALNFAATLKCQTIFICRNNGYAISTPTRDQYQGDGIVVRGVGYGMNSIRVEGNDLFAVYHATREARRICVETQSPVLIEAMTYRAGHHSTSDDASRYREKDELEYWQTKQNPVTRLRKYLVKRDLWDDQLEKREREQNKKQVLELVQELEHAPLTPFSELVTDVFDAVPEHLQVQKDWVQSIVEKYPEAYEKSH